jgi:hypothetical protein
MIFAYLALPYSGTVEQIEERVKAMTRLDAQLMKSGIFTVSPVYKHLMRLNHIDIPGDWAYWGEYSVQLLKRCDAMYVLCLDGWMESTGVQAEIKEAKILGVQIVYVTEIDTGAYTFSIE